MKRAAIHMPTIISIGLRMSFEAKSDDKYPILAKTASKLATLNYKYFSKPQNCNCLTLTPTK